LEDGYCQREEVFVAKFDFSLCTIHTTVSLLPSMIEMIEFLQKVRVDLHHEQLLSLCVPQSHQRSVSKKWQRRVETESILLSGIEDGRWELLEEQQQRQQERKNGERRYLWLERERYFFFWRVRNIQEQEQVLEEEQQGRWEDPHPSALVKSEMKPQGIGRISLEEERKELVESWPHEEEILGLVQQEDQQQKWLDLERSPLQEALELNLVETLVTRVEKSEEVWGREDDPGSVREEALS
jgi:hypothetical protein